MSPANMLVRTGVAEALRHYPRLRLIPGGDAITLTGNLDLCVQAPGHRVIHDCFGVRLVVTDAFPAAPPGVWSTDGRIPKSFHSLSDGSFCLGSPVRLRLLLGDRYTLAEFIDRCVIPYLYGFAHLQRHGTLPFGELKHGRQGLVEDYERLFGLTGPVAVVTLLALLAMRRRVANKRPCPCGSGQRLGRCHNRVANHLRASLGHAWCSSEAARLYELYQDLLIPDPKVRRSLNAAAPPSHSPSQQVRAVVRLSNIVRHKGVRLTGNDDPGHAKGADPSTAILPRAKNPCGRECTEANGREK